MILEDDGSDEASLDGTFEDGVMVGKLELESNELGNPLVGSLYVGMFSPSEEGPTEEASEPVEEAADVGELFVNAVYVAVPVKFSVEVLCAIAPAITINSEKERVEVLIFVILYKINLASEY